MHKTHLRNKQFLHNHHLLKIRSQVADFSIEPNVSKVDAADFQHALEIAAIGKAAADAAMKPLLDQLRSLDVGLAPPSPTDAVT